MTVTLADVKYLEHVHVPTNPATCLVNTVVTSNPIGHFILNVKVWLSADVGTCNNLDTHSDEVIHVWSTLGKDTL